MLSKMKVLPRLAAALAVAAALTFGTAQAFARMDCSPPITACNSEPPEFCNDVFCPEHYRYGGVCNTIDDCCLCLEK